MDPGAPICSAPRYRPPVLPRADSMRIEPPAASSQAAEGRAESHRSRTDTASARKETVNAMAYPGFPSNCYSDPYLDLYDFADGRLEVRWRGQALPYRVFDKDQRVSHTAIIENKRFGHALRSSRRSRISRTARR
jgi:hypothetical protein